MTDLTLTSLASTQTEFGATADLSRPELGLPRLNLTRRLIEQHELLTLIDHEDVLIVDVRAPEQCIDGHIPNAVMLNSSELTQQNGPATGLLPDAQSLSRTFSTIGLSQDQYVVAYDDDTGIHAARLLWTLDMIGHHNHSLLHGGFAGWDEAELPVFASPKRPDHRTYNAIIDDDAWVDFDYLKSVIGDPNVVLLDTRSPHEYSGETVRAHRGGHIPGAINYDWTLTIDLMDDGRFRPDAEIIESLRTLGVTPDKEVIPYCHTHQRSAHTYLVLKHLGYPNVRAYPGSWSEWGNDETAPIEC